MEKIVVAELFEVISEFKGELANEYKTRQEYVESGAFEKDYFASWLEGCSDYPYLGEIIEFCQSVDAAIQEWLKAVEDGSIDPEAGWAEEEPDLYWECDTGSSTPRWVLFRHTEDDEEEIAEVGQDEDGTYYWVDLMDDDGYCGFDTMDEAKADIEAYFNKH